MKRRQQRARSQRTIRLCVVLCIAAECLFCATSSNQCHILALASGGDRGAYEAGVLKGLAEIIPDDIGWDIVTGVSIGAANAASVSMFKIGEEVQAAAHLVDFWVNKMNASAMYRNWPGGVVEGFFFKPALFDTSAGRVWWESQINQTAIQQTDRKLRMRSVNLSKNKPVYFDETFPDTAMAAAASCAVPGLFPPVDIDGDQHVDGSFNGMSIAMDAVEMCKEAGKDNITLDAVLAVDFLPEDKPLAGATTPVVLFRTFLYFMKVLFEGNIDEVRAAHPDVTVREYYPSEHLPGDFFEFKPANSQKMVNVGYKDALRVARAR